MNHLFWDNNKIWVNVGTLAVILCLAVILSMGVTGCVTTPAVNSGKPVDFVFFVQADKFWQNSGIYVKRGQLIQCSAEGKWSDLDGTYGPEGNTASYIEHLGVRAPANALLMRLSSETNMAYCIGSETNILAERSGNILFRNNVSLSTGMSGQLRVNVMVAPDADRDGLSDYEEVHIWHTNPLDPDSDGDGFNDVEEVSDKKSHSKAAYHLPAEDRK